MLVSLFLYPIDPIHHNVVNQCRHTVQCPVLWDVLCGDIRTPPNALDIHPM